MKSKKRKAIYRNITTGFTLKFVQLACSFLSVPILIADEGLGLHGYGQLAVALAVGALPSMLFDGFRLSVSRGMAINSNALFDATCLYTKYILFLCAPIVVLGVLFWHQIAEAAALNIDTRYVISYILLFFTLEQLLYIVEQYFHCLLKTSLLNIVNSLEAIIRLMGVGLIFQGQEGSIEDYFVLYIATYLVKISLYWALIASRRVEGGRICRWSHRESFTTFFQDSSALSLKAIMTFVVFRFSVIYANRVLSSEAAAVYAIIFVTLRNYITQLFVAVFRPMIIPLTANDNIIDYDKNIRIDFELVLSFYEFVVVCAVLLMAASVTGWLPLWAGSEVASHHSLIAMGIAVLGIESALSMKGLILIGQGFGRILSVLSFVCCSFYGLSLYVLTEAVGINLLYLICLAAGYIIIYYGISVNVLYMKKMNGKLRSALAPIGSIVGALALFYILQNCVNSKSCVISSVSVSMVITGILACANATAFSRIFRAILRKVNCVH